jgi:hypothetical protein
VRTVLEIGSASGDGSTRAIVAGAERRSGRPAIFCVEAVRERFVELERRYRDRPFVHAYNASTVSSDQYASEREVGDFYRAFATALNAFPLERVLGWRSTELAYLDSARIEMRGIERIRREHGIEHFDAVLIDGSEFTAGAELELVHGAWYLVLDDTNSFKNHANCSRLLADDDYELVAADSRLRNGYAVFRRRSASR